MGTDDTPPEVSLQTRSVEIYSPSSSTNNGRRPSRDRLSRAMRSKRSNTKNDWVETFSPKKSDRTRRQEVPADSTKAGAQKEEETVPKSPLRTGTATETLSTKKNHNEIDDAILNDQQTKANVVSDETIIGTSDLLTPTLSSKERATTEQSDENQEGKRNESGSVEYAYVAACCVTNKEDTVGTSVTNHVGDKQKMMLKAPPSAPASKSNIKSLSPTKSKEARDKEYNIGTLVDKKTTAATGAVKPVALQPGQKETELGSEIKDGENNCKINMHEKGIKKKKRSLSRLLNDLKPYNNPGEGSPDGDHAYLSANAYIEEMKVDTGVPDRVQKKQMSSQYELTVASKTGRKRRSSTIANDRRKIINTGRSLNEEGSGRTTFLLKATTMTSLEKTQVYERDLDEGKGYEFELQSQHFKVDTITDTLSRKKK